MLQFNQVIGRNKRMEMGITSSPLSLPKMIKSSIKMLSYNNFSHSNNRDGVIWDIISDKDAILGCIDFLIKKGEIKEDTHGLLYV